MKGQATVAEAVKRRAGLRMRQGVVTAVDGTTCTVLIGGSTVPVEGVQHLNSCNPAVGDVVWITSDGADLWIVGTHGAPPPIDPSQLPTFATYFTDSDTPGVPAAVTHLAGDCAFSTVILSWDLPPEALWRTWQVYEGTAAGFAPVTPILTTPTNVVQLTKATGSGPWYYKVRAINSRGEASADVQVGPFTLPTLAHVDLGAGSVYAANMAAGAVDLASAVVTGQLVAAKIADNAITQAKLAAAIVDATKLADDAVTAAKIAAGAVGNTELAALAVDGPKIAAGAITAAKIAAGTITANEIAAATITGAKIAAATIAAGNIVADTITAAKIAAGTITTAEIAADTIVAGNIAAGAIGASEIAAGAVVAGKIAANAVTATEIAAGAITTAKLVAGAITANELAANAVTAAKIVAGTITADRIAAGTLTANEIAAGTITAAKMNVADVQAAVVTAAKINTLTLNAISITGGTISGTTITGATIQTAAAGARTVMSSAFQGIKFFSGIAGETDARAAFVESVVTGTSVHQLLLRGPNLGYADNSWLSLDGSNVGTVAALGSGAVELELKAATGQVSIYNGSLIVDRAIRAGNSCASGVSDDGIWINDLTTAGRRWKLYMNGGQLYARYGSAGSEYKVIGP
jgi:hypothetical protein